jgi:hypothetical protein
MRAMLANEMRADLYPPTGDGASGPSVAEDVAAIGQAAVCKRFRLLQALLVALRELGDREAVPLVREVLGTTHHFYPVYHAAAAFLGELGGTEDVPLLEEWARYPEVNANHAAQEALRALRGEG